MERDTSNAENHKAENHKAESKQPDASSAKARLDQVSKHQSSQNVQESAQRTVRSSGPVRGGVDALVKTQTPQAEAELSKKIQTAAKDAYLKRKQEQGGQEVDRVESLQLQIQRLKATIDVIERRFSSAKRLNKDQYQQLQQQLDALGQQLSQTQHLSANTSEKIGKLVPDYQTQQKEQAQQFVALNLAHQKVVKRIESQLQVWASEIEQQLGALQGALERSDDQTAQIDKLNHCMQGLQTELVAALSEMKSQTEANQKVQQHMRQAANKQHQDFEGLRQALNQEVDQARAIHRELTGLLDAFCVKQKAAFGDYETLRRALKADRASLGQERKDVSHLREELAHLQAMTIEAHRAASEHQAASKARLVQIEKMAASKLGEVAGERAQVHQGFVGAQVASERAIEASLQAELEGLSQLKANITAAQNQLGQVCTAQNQQGRQLQDLTAKTQSLGDQLSEGLDRLSTTVEQQQGLESRFKSYALKIEQALAQTDAGLEKVDGLTTQCKETREHVADLQNQWQLWGKHWEQWGQEWECQWQRLSSANDEQYKNLSALLTRSRDNEAQLERLLESVKGLESRSEYLLETAQTQRQKQHDFAQRIQAEHAEVAALRQTSQQVLSSAEHAATQANTASQSADNVLKVVQGVQAEVLLEHEAVMDKATAAQDWIESALSQAKVIQTQTQSLSERQKALEAQCKALLSDSGEKVGKMAHLQQEAAALHEQMQSKLEKTRQIEQTAQLALARVGQLEAVVAGDHEKLEAFHQEAALELANSVAENQALIEQARALQNALEAQTKAQAKAQQAFEALQGQVWGQEGRVDSALDKAQALHESWEAHTERMASLEQRTEDALSANQALHEAAKTLLNSASDEQQQLQAVMTEAKQMVQSVADTLEKEQALRSDTTRLQAVISEQVRKQEAVAQDQASVVLRTEVMHDQFTEMEKKHQANLSAMEDLHKRASTLLSENIELQAEVRQGQAQLTDMVDRVDENLDRTEKIHGATTQQLDACQLRCHQMDEALPKLGKELARYEQLGKDYSQWEARLKSQSMTLKDAERKLKEQCRVLDSGLLDVGKVREEMTGLGQEFGNVKKVLAQLMQKFKGVEQTGAFLETRCQSLASDQAEQGEKLTQLRAALTKVDQRVPDEKLLQGALEQIRLQREFNDSVLDKVDGLAKRYVNMQEQLHLLHTLPSAVSGLDARLKVLESAVGQGVGQEGQSEETLAQLDAQVHRQGAALGSVEGEIRSLRKELSELAKTMRTVPQFEAVAAVPPASAAVPVAPQDQPSVVITPTLSGEPPREETKSESELHRLSEQLERLSREAQSWDEPSQGTEKRRVKQFLFSLLAMLMVTAGGQWIGEPASSPTFAHEHFSLNLIHPDQRFDGPKLSANAVAMIHQGQALSTLELQGLVRQVQWPIPKEDRRAQVRSSKASHAVYIPSHSDGPVTAIDEGRVLFSGLSEGDFGKVVIVAHPGALVSVYGYLQEAWVDSGAEVQQGQVIARLAKTPDAELYFELRFEGEPVPAEHLLQYSTLPPISPFQYV